MSETPKPQTFLTDLCLNLSVKYFLDFSCLPVQECLSGNDSTKVCAVIPIWTIIMPLSVTAHFQNSTHCMPTLVVGRFHRPVHSKLPYLFSLQPVWALTGGCFKADIFVISSCVMDCSTRWPKHLCEDWKKFKFCLSYSPLHIWLIIAWSRHGWQIVVSKIVKCRLFDCSIGKLFGEGF